MIMDKEPIELDYVFGSLELAKRFNVSRSVILDLAKTKKVDCIWCVGVPLFNQKGVEKIEKLLKKSDSQRSDD
jgi:hypothetical protein